MSKHFDLTNFVLSHLGNTHEWYILPFMAPVHLPGILSLHLLMLLIGSFVLFVVFLAVYRKDDRVPTGITNFLEMVVVYIRDQIAVPALGEKDGLLFTPYLCTLGFLVLICNIMGLLPFFEPATSNINMTGALAYPILILLFFGTMVRGGLKGFWQGLIPPGIITGLPIWISVFLLPILIPIEIISLLFRSAALGLRLFVTMVAGHVLIMAFLGLCLMFPLFSPVSFAFAVAFFLLDIFICFLQAYIFILLSAIFIGLMYHPKH